MCRIGSAAARHDLIDKLISRFAFLSVVRRVIKLYRNHRSQIAIAKQEIDVLPVDRLKGNCEFPAPIVTWTRSAAPTLAKTLCPAEMKRFRPLPQSFGVAP